MSSLTSIDLSHHNSNGNLKSLDTLCPVAEIGEIDFSKVLDKPRTLNIERQRSCDERSMSELSIGFSPRQLFAKPDMFSRFGDHLDSPMQKSGLNTPRSLILDSNSIFPEAWEALRRSLVHFRGEPVGTIAAMEDSDEKLNYDQVFVRDFVPSALAFLMHGEPDIVKNFLLKTLRLQSWEKKIDRFQLAEGVMPASFKVFHDPVRNRETLIADFCESAIGRVAPVDSGFWWIILLR
ncbi:hypothetical protein KIW84_044309, partial [Lathyrus oleraceus]